MTVPVRSASDANPTLEAFDITDDLGSELDWEPPQVYFDGDEDTTYDAEWLGEVGTTRNLTIPLADAITAGLEVDRGHGVTLVNPNGSDLRLGSFYLTP